MANMYDNELSNPNQSESNMNRINVKPIENDQSIEIGQFNNFTSNERKDTRLPSANGRAPLNRLPPLLRNIDK